MFFHHCLSSLYPLPLPPMPFLSLPPRNSFSFLFLFCSIPPPQMFLSDCSRCHNKAKASELASPLTCEEPQQVPVPQEQEGFTCVLAPGVVVSLVARVLRYLDLHAGRFTGNKLFNYYATKYLITITDTCRNFYKQITGCRRRQKISR